MSLDNIDVIDAVGIEEQNGIVVLSIIDGWDWGDERHHLLILQSKLNAYFRFVESGQIYEAYPEAEGRLSRIDIIAKHPIPDTALAFLKKASAVAAQLNMTMTHRVH